MRKLLYLILAMMIMVPALAQNEGLWYNMNQYNSRTKRLKADSLLLNPRLNYFPAPPTNFEVPPRQFSPIGAQIIYANPTDSTRADWPYWWDGTKWWTFSFRGYGSKEYVDTIYIRSSGTCSDSLFYVKGGLEYFVDVIERKDGLVSPLREGLVSYTGVGMDFAVTAATYYIGCVQYNSRDTVLTLANGDPTYGRYDVFVVDTSGNTYVIQGIPAQNPIVPQHDPSYQIVLTTVYIPPGATTPQLATEVIYNENVLPEWVPPTGTGVVINPDNTTNVYLATKSLDVSTITTNDYIMFVRSAPIDLTQYDKASLWFKLKAIGQKNQRLYMQFFLGAVPVTQEVLVPFQSLITDYIPISVMMSTLAPTAPADRVRLRWTAPNNAPTHPGFYIDWFRLEKGSAPPPSDYLTDVRRYLNTDTIQKQINGVWQYAFTDSMGIVDAWKVADSFYFKYHSGQIKALKDSVGVFVDSFYYNLRALNNTTVVFDRSDGRVDTLIIPDYTDTFDVARLGDTDNIMKYINGVPTYAFTDSMGIIDTWKVADSFYYKYHSGEIKALKDSIGITQLPPQDTCYMLNSGGFVTDHVTVDTCYNVSTAVFTINCKQYTALADTVCIQPPCDTLLFRIDLVYADTLGNISIIQGTCDTAAVFPQADPTWQYPLTYLLVYGGDSVMKWPIAPNYVHYGKNNRGITFGDFKFTYLDTPYNLVLIGTSDFLLRENNNGRYRLKTNGDIGVNGVVHLNDNMSGYWPPWGGIRFEANGYQSRGIWGIANQGSINITGDNALVSNVYVDGQAQITPGGSQGDWLNFMAVYDSASWRPQVIYHPVTGRVLNQFIFDVNSSRRAMRIPAITKVNLDKIKYNYMSANAANTSLTKGMIAYDLTNECLVFSRDTGWVNLCAITPPVISNTVNNGLTENPAGNFQWGGTLIQNTTINSGSSYYSLFSGSLNSSSGILRALNTSTFGTAIVGQADGGSGVYGSSTTSNGVYGFSTNGYGLYGVSTNSYGAYTSGSVGIGALGTTLGGIIDVDPPSFNSNATILNIRRNTTGTAAVGIAGNLAFDIEISDGSGADAGTIGYELTNVTPGAVASKFYVSTAASSVLNNRLELNNLGQLRLNSYGSGTFTGTATKWLAVDASGNVIEENVPSAAVTGDSLVLKKYSTNLNQIRSWNGGGLLSSLNPTATDVGSDSVNYVIGYKAGDSLSTGWRNIFIGSQTGRRASTANNNLAIGHRALGSGATFTGQENLVLSNGANNTATNPGAMKLATTASRNIVIGGGSSVSAPGITGGAITTASGNVLIGALAAGTLSTGNDNIFIGRTPNIGTATSSYNIGIGTNSYADASGTAVGTAAIAAGGVALGYNTGLYGGIGYYPRNTLIGTAIGVTNGGSSATDSSVIIGHWAYGIPNSSTQTNVSSNVIIGAYAGGAITGGNNNVAIGTHVQRDNGFAGRYNVIIGSRATLPSATASHQVVIGGSIGDNRLVRDSVGRWGIGTNTPQSLLDLVSTTSGLLVPRMTGTEQNAIATPPTGLLVYNTDSTAHTYYTGSAWRKYGTGAISMDSIAVKRIGVHYVGWNSGSGSNGTNGGTQRLSGDSSNVLIGYQTGRQITTGYGNIDIGIRSWNGVVGYGGPSTGTFNTILGAQTTISTPGISGDYNVLLGFRAGYSLTSGSRNIFISSGTNTGQPYNGNNISTGNDNVHIGYGRGGAAARSGSIAIGPYTGGGESAVSIGNASGELATGTSNVLIGTNTGRSLSGNYNIGIGIRAMDGTTQTGSGNVVLGHFDNNSNLVDQGSNNIIFGYRPVGHNGTLSNQVTFAGNSVNWLTKFSTQNWLFNMTGSAVTAVPNASAALEINGTAGGFLAPRLTGAQQNAIATPATGLLIYNTDSLAHTYYDGSAWKKYGSGGVSGGTQHLFYNDAVRTFYSTNSITATNGGNSPNRRNVAIGDSALRAATTANNNIMLGFSAGRLITTGYDNIGIGYQALQSSGTGYNIAIGTQAMTQTNITGGYNIAIGDLSQYLVTSGSYNVGIAGRSLNSNTTGSFNVAVGYNAIGRPSTSNKNSGIGYMSLLGAQSVAAGDENAALGYTAGIYNTSGSGNVYIGSEAGRINDVGANTQLISGGWTTTGWTGSGNTWTHTVGNTSVLSNSIAAISGQWYQIEITTTGRTAGSVTVSFGGTPNPPYIASNGSTISQISTTSTASLTVTPTSDFDGTVTVNLYKTFSSKTVDGVYIGRNVRTYDGTESNSIVIGALAIGRGSNTTTIGTSSTTSTKLFGRIYTNKGSDVASAGDITLGTGNVFTITGTTTINAINTTNWQTGSIVVLLFSGATTVSHNVAGGAGTAPLFLSGSTNMTTAANSTLTLMYDGTQWQEIARKQP